MTNVSSVGIRLRQSDSNSNRPTPTVSSILSFIDGRQEEMQPKEKQNIECKVPDCKVPEQLLALFEWMNKNWH